MWNNTEIQNKLKSKIKYRNGAVMTLESIFILSRPAIQILEKNILKKK
jgi:hypothetical protein